MPMVKKEVVTEPPKWWDRFAHPLTDDQFVTAFCEHVLATTTDYSLVIVRNRAFRFIRNFMAPALAQQLEEYRKAHP